MAGTDLVTEAQLSALVTLLGAKVPHRLITVGAVAPSTPTVGDVWVDTTQAVTVSAGGGGGIDGGTWDSVYGGTAAIDGGGF